MKKADVVSTGAIAYSKLRLKMDISDHRDLDGEIRKCEERIAELNTLLDAEKVEPPQIGRKRKWARKLQKWLQRNSNRRGALIRVRGRLDSLRAQQLMYDAKSEHLYVSEYHALCRIPRVQAISVSPPNLLIETEMLYGRECRIGAKWRRIGQFGIRYALDSRNWCAVTWVNRSGLFFDGFAAPTGIYPNGTCGCLGTLSQKLQDAHRDRRMVDLVSLLVRFPECPGNGNRIAKWPPVHRNEVPQWYLETFD